MALFIGSFENKVDRKGRVSVPAQFRAALAGQKFNGVVCYPGLYEQTIEAYSESDMQRLAESLEQLDQFSQVRSDFESIFADARQLPFDGDGRIILPPSFTEFAGISEAAIFVSAVDHFQIWSPEIYAQKRSSARERLQAQRVTLKVRPSGGNGPVGTGPSDGR